jgi:hypothetical protein
LLRPLLPRLTERQLIELLKDPFCLAGDQLALLRELGQRCDRPQARRIEAAQVVVGPIGGEVLVREARAFRDLWECVAYLRQQRRDLDLSAPPR